MIAMTVDYFCDQFTLEQLQRAVIDIDKDADAHDLKWYTISDRATKMREIRSNMIEALVIKKMTNITAEKAEKAGQV